MCADTVSAFTAHNIRLDDGTETMPGTPWTMGEHPVTQAAGRALRLLYPEGLTGKTIIDVGCLEGGYATEFARMGMTATGLDVRESNYRNCLHVKSHVNLPNLSFIRADAKDIARHGRFDVFWVNGLLYHLDRPRRFLIDVAAACNRAVLINTHVAHSNKTEAAETYSLSELCENEGLMGRWYPDHPEMQSEELDQLKWASWDNTESFWIQKEYLIGLLLDLGFCLVFEQYDWLSGNDVALEMTNGAYKKLDRVVLVGVKS